MLKWAALSHPLCHIPSAAPHVVRPSSVASKIHVISEGSLGAQPCLAPRLSRGAVNEWMAYVGSAWDAPIDASPQRSHSIAPTRAHVSSGPLWAWLCPLHTFRARRGHATTHRHHSTMYRTCHGPLRRHCLCPSPARPDRLLWRPHPLHPLRFVWQSRALTQEPG